MARGKLQRRGLMAVALAAAVGLPAVASVPPDGDLAFRVLRGDSPMGDHRLSFQRDGERLEVLVSIDLDVKLGPFTLYEYTHENREVWREGRLVRLSTETDDDGESFFVEAERTDAGLRVETRDGSRIVPGDIVPSSYWNYAIVEAEQVLDTQKGRVLDVSTDFLGETEIWVNGALIPARHYRMRGDLELDLWYDAEREWVKTAFEIRGEQIEYFRGGVPENLEQASYFAQQRGEGASLGGGGGDR